MVVAGWRRGTGPYMAVVWRSWGWAGFGVPVVVRMSAPTGAGMVGCCRRTTLVMVAGNGTYTGTMTRCGWCCLGHNRQAHQSKYEGYFLHCMKYVLSLLNSLVVITTFRGTRSLHKIYKPRKKIRIYVEREVLNLPEGVIRYRLRAWRRLLTI